MAAQPIAEECERGGIATERFEVFQLGFILHFLLTQTDNSTDPMTNPPVLPASITDSDDLAVLGLKSAMERAFTVKEKERPKAREIGDFLANVATQIEEEDHDGR